VFKTTIYNLCPRCKLKTQSPKKFRINTTNKYDIINFCDQPLFFYKYIESCRTTAANYKRRGNRDKKRNLRILVYPKNMVKRLLIDTNRIVFKENQRSSCEDKPPLLPRLPPNSCKVNRQDSEIL
jgi:hypothetical protein